MDFLRYPRSHDELCDALISEGLLKTPEIIRSFRDTDRKHFTPSASPYGDHPYEIGGEATISAPHMHALSLELLSENIVPQAGDTAKSFCDVGSGSGYVTGLFSNMIYRWRQAGAPLGDIGAKSHVVGVEIHPGLAKQSVENISKCHPELVDGGDADTIFQVVNHDAFKGELLPHAPFDAIHVGVGVDQTPLGLLAQLKPGGKCVIPVGVGEQSLYVYQRKTTSTEPLESFVSNAMAALHTRNSQHISSFLNEHFTKDYELRCRFIRAQTEQTVPAHVPALRPKHD